MTETLAALPVTEQAALGFTAADFILDCTYDGVPCNMDTYVKLLWFICLFYVNSVIILKILTREIINIKPLLFPQMINFIINGADCFAARLQFNYVCKRQFVGEKKESLYLR